MPVVPSQTRQGATRAAWAARAGDATTLQGATRADLTYTAGTGLTLNAGVFAADPTWVSAQARLAAYDTPTELTTALAGEYRAANWVPSWSEIQGRPAGLDDGDDDLRYTAGAGLSVPRRTATRTRSPCKRRRRGSSCATPPPASPSAKARP